MSQATSLDQDVTVGEVPGDLTLDLHSWGLAGCIDRLTIPLRRQGMRLRFETPHHGLEIPAASAVLLYRVAQELLSNALRHSEASEVTVRLEAVYHGIRLSIRDNGIGFNTESQVPGVKKPGYGLCLMTMAVYEANGTISTDSSLGEGTRVCVTLPLD